MTTLSSDCRPRQPRPFPIPLSHRGAAGGAIARPIVRAVVRRVPIRLRFPDGSHVGGGTSTSPTLEVVRPRALFRRLEQHPKIGLGEAYMAGDWRAAPGTDLAEALTPFAASLATVVPRPLIALRAVVDRRPPRAHRNTRTGAKANIEAHYDLSNNLFETFLDPSMTYSSALFEEGIPFAEQDLERAQERKIDAVLDEAHVGPGSRLLEIGTGWGALALRAARRGARVLTVTLSQEQAALARARIADAGLADQVEVRIQDYRDVVGTFDAIVSVEMIEAVGEEFWPEYLQALDRLLAPEGQVVLQAILMDHHRYLRTRHSFGWIQKYIFPGGLIPSRQALEEVAAQDTHLHVEQTRSFGAHYAETLRRWRTDFVAQAEQVHHLGFDETFRRMWEYYLAYSEAGFASGYLDVAHLRLSRGAVR
ncbi:MAG: class I SAM-dependent methyltransferase [Phycicoccus sp.]|nr:class I SAM-dependent methyltransferase [Phycicoccus sp.]